jgi:hypothetical protein
MKYTTQHSRTLRHNRCFGDQCNFRNKLSFLLKKNHNPKHFPKSAGYTTRGTAGVREEVEVHSKNHLPEGHNVEPRVARLANCIGSSMKQWK